MRETEAVPEQRWEPLANEDVVRLFAGIGKPWWIAGGRGLDLFLRHDTRSHADLDVSILRRDQDDFRGRLGSWDVQIAHEGTLVPWKRGDQISTPARHVVWARERPEGPWKLELLLEESDGPRWTYRRDSRIGLNIADLGRMDEREIPFLRPEVTLLYKSSSPRPVDETDFLYVLPRLDVAQKGWLFAAIYTLDPTHRWLERLK
ncbi:MAG TPA: amino acid transporter [Candidatus Limnocylindria bacterium]|nr:amino acid transporter [Candidatus Limnocylindria bacterium]